MVFLVLCIAAAQKNQTDVLCTSLNYCPQSWHLASLYMWVSQTHKMCLGHFLFKIRHTMTGHLSWLYHILKYHHCCRNYTCQFLAFVHQTIKLWNHLTCPPFKVLLSLPGMVTQNVRATGRLQTLFTTRKHSLKCFIKEKNIKLSNKESKIELFCA